MGCGGVNMITRLRRIAIGLCAIAIGVVLPATAQDTIGNGDGHSGSFVAPPGVSSVNIYTTLASDAAAGAPSINLASATGLAAGDVIMVWRPAAYPGPDPRNINNEGSARIDLSNSDVGRYELHRILSLAGSAVTLSDTLQHGFAGGVTQVIRVPEYSDVSVPAGSTLRPGQDWDGHKGGVIAFLVTGDITVEGGISADGSGFRGGSGSFVPSDPCHPIKAFTGESIGGPSSPTPGALFNGGAPFVYGVVGEVIGDPCGVYFASGPSS